MKYRLKLKLPIIMIAMMPLILLASAACSGKGPQEMEIPVKLAGGTLDPNTISVGQGDTVTLKIQTDKPGAFHLHGYNIEKDVKAGEVTDLIFVADATGRFSIGFHPAVDSAGSHADEEAHGAIFQSGVLQVGDTFSFEVPQDIGEKTIPYHSHLHPELSGVINLSDGAPPSETVEVAIRGMAVDPAEITVRPGTRITWINYGRDSQLLASGVHPGAEAESDHAGTSQESQTGGNDHSETEELDIGFLEVRP